MSYFHNVGFGDSECRAKFRNESIGSHFEVALYYGNSCSKRQSSSLLLCIGAHSCEA